MFRGRDKFQKIKRPILFLSQAVGNLPYSTRYALLKHFRNYNGNSGLVVRYILIKSLTKKCGDNVSIHPSVMIFAPENLEIGDNVSIHPFCYIDATGGISIGNDVSIAHASTVMSTEHEYKAKDIPIKDQGVSMSPTVIHDNVWIASGVRILAGTVISAGTIVAAGAVAKNRLKANSIYGGIPAKHLKDR